MALRRNAETIPDNISRGGNPTEDGWLKKEVYEQIYGNERRYEPHCNIYESFVYPRECA